MTIKENFFNKILKYYYFRNAYYNVNSHQYFFLLHIYNLLTQIIQKDFIMRHQRRIYQIFFNDSTKSIFEK